MKVNSVINIVIPMAGEGSRFSSAGYKIPKPFLPIHGLEMISAVIQNLRPTSAHRFILLTRRGHDEYLSKVVQRESNNNSKIEIVFVDELTEGAACTVLLAREFIDNDDELMIANSDQWVDIDINEYLSVMHADEIDGLVMTMTANDPKWSFCEINQSGEITRIVEKEVISNVATVGIYNFRKGCDFVSAADSMISQNLRVNGEFYVAPVYNQLILQGKKFLPWGVGEEGAGMYGLGIPSDFEAFIANPISQKASKL
jgi:dTDP-glucose pyrophosphorylase